MEYNFYSGFGSVLHCKSFYSCTSTPVKNTEKNKKQEKKNKLLLFRFFLLLIKKKKPLPGCSLWSSKGETSSSPPPSRPLRPPPTFFWLLQLQPNLADENFLTILPQPLQGLCFPLSHSRYTQVFTASVCCTTLVSKSISLPVSFICWCFCMRPCCCWESLLPLTSQQRCHSQNRPFFFLQLVQ